MSWSRTHARKRREKPVDSLRVAAAASRGSSAARTCIRRRPLATSSFRAIEAAGEELVGIYHSHPVSQPYPSPTDRAEAHYPDALYILVSLRTGTPEVRAFRIDSEQFVREVPIAVERRGLARLLTNTPGRGH